MTRRPAVTLMEVLIAMFIMAIGMLALMALFPVGAVSMAQALKDDRCAYASYVSENVAIVNNIRYGDSAVVTHLASSSSGLVYVDPYAAQYITIQPTLATLGGVIPRIAPSCVYFTPPTPPPTPVLTLSLIDRWFSLQDDIGYNLSATPDTSNTGGIIDRGRGYSYAYLLRRQLPFSISPSPTPVGLYAVVYSGRPVNSLATTMTEWPLTLTVPAAGYVNANSVQVNGISLPLKRGGWVFEPTNGYFYRVTNLAENTFSLTTTVDLEQNLAGILPITTIIGMDYVAEVFDKGVGWQQ